jgi:hypothetical protein
LLFEIVFGLAFSTFAIFDLVSRHYITYGAALNKEGEKTRATASPSTAVSELRQGP